MDLRGDNLYRFKDGDAVAPGQVVIQTDQIGQHAPDFFLNLRAAVLENGDDLVPRFGKQRSE